MGAETPARHHSTRPPAVGSLMAYGLRRTITSVQGLYARGGPKGCGRKSIRRRGTPWGQR